MYSGYLGASKAGRTAIADGKSQPAVIGGKKCAVKGAGLQRVQRPPGNWIAPPGSNRSGGEGNEAVGAFDEKGR